MDGLLYTAKNEGLVLVAYDDATGEPPAPGAALQGTLTIGRGHTGPEVVEGLQWTQEEAERVFQRDYALAQAEAAIVASRECWVRLDPVRRAVLADLAFELGEEGLGHFVHMLAAIRAYQWPDAGAELGKSRLAAETPARFRRNFHMLVSGCWPTPNLW